MSKHNDEFSSNSMWSKVKDGIYRISDIIICLLVIFAMYFTLNGKLQSVMPISVDKDTKVSKVKEEPAGNAEKINVNKDKEKNKTKDKAEKKTEKDKTDNENKSEQDKKEDKKVQETMISITIPSGSNAISIAKLLKDNDIIKSEGDFLAVVNKKNIAKNFKAGTFSIPSNASNEKICDILTIK